ncbi:MAG: DUF1326 domain-containing protein [Gaiellaceae bacterium]
MAEEWELEGKVVVACNCDFGCPCNFNALPTTGKCEGGWTWHVESGRYGDVALDGLNFSVYVNWPGAIHEGGGEAVLLVDERAGDGQREAIMTLLGGEAGGPWGILAWTWPTVHGPHSVAYEVELEGVRTTIRAGEALELKSGPIRNPVTGNEVHPGAVLPEGIIFKRGDFGASETFRLQDGVAYDHSGKYTAVADFAYSGP